MDLHVNCCSKYFLFTFNTIFWIVSLVFIAIASWAWHTKGFFDSLDEVTGIPVGKVQKKIEFHIENLYFFYNFVEFLQSCEKYKFAEFLQSCRHSQVRMISTQF